MNILIQYKKIKPTLLLLMLLFINNAIAQVNISHKSDWFFINPGVDVFIEGNITSLDSNADAIINLGEMYITDTITCFGTNKIFGVTPDVSTGNVYLIGEKSQFFMGNQNMRFGNLTIQNTYDSLFILNNVDIYGDLQLDYGNIYIPDFLNLDFLVTGELVGETSAKRIHGNNYSIMHLNRPLINGVTYTNLGGFGLDITINGNLGTNTHLWRKNVQQVNVSNGSIDRFYTFSPENNGYVSNPNIYYLDTIELHGNNEGSLKLYMSQTNGNTWVEKGGIVDTINDKVSTDASLSIVLSNQSMFTLAEANCQNPPYLHFALDTIPLCDNAPAWLFADGTIGMSSVWSNGVINSDSIQITNTGTYKVTITDIYGCPTTDSVVVISAPNPVTDFTVAAVCIGAVSDFTNTTTISSGSISYAWDMADIYSANTDTSSIENPTITYTNQGSFSVNLKATSNYGCKSQKTKLAVVNPYPIVNFTVQSDCADSSVNITNSTIVLPNNSITYNWNFGDGDSSLSEVPAHSYNTEGSYIVELKATSLSCTTTLSKTVDINPNPNPLFSAAAVCVAQSSVFSNTTSIASGSNTYSWRFETGSNSVLTNPTYGFNNAGIYPIKLIATSDLGCINDTTIDIIVNALPTTSFTVNAICQETSMQFTNSSNANSAFSWNFDNEGQSTDYNPQYIFNTSGTKTIVLTETDINGCINTKTQTVVSKPKPIANFIINDACEQENITFLNNTSTPSGNLTYEWDFDDSHSSTLNSPTHTFSLASTYNVKLIAENNGCFDTITQASTIYPKPVLNLGGIVATCADSLILDAQNSGSTYLWSNQSDAQTLTVKYNGIYWVDITSVDGCNLSDTVIIALSSVVKPNIGEDSTFCDNAELYAGYTGSSFLWSTGATTQTVNINTSSTVWVKVTDQNNCIGYDTIMATVVSSILPNAGSDLLKCDGEITALNSGQVGMTYLWSTGSINDTIYINQTGNYWVELTDQNNCVSYDTVLVVYNSNPIINLGLDGNYCDSAVYSISQSNATYLWDNGSTLADRTILSGGQYWAIINDTITTCSSTDTVLISMSATPIVNLGNDDTLCNGDYIILDAGYPQDSYLWNIGDTTQAVVAAATGVYIVDVITPQGCVGNDSILVTISNPLNPYLGEDFVLCRNSVTQISSPINNVYYSWTLNDTLLSDTTQTVSISKPGELISNVTDIYGCSAEDTLILLTTSSELYADFMSATQHVYVGDTIVFMNLSYPNTFSSYWSFDDGYLSAQKSPTHIYSNVGVYKVILEVDNGICTDTISKNISIQSAVKKRIALDGQRNRIINYSLYPNPNNGSFSLNIELVQKSKITIDCFNIYGQLINHKIIDAKETIAKYNLTELAVGLYFIRISIEEQVEIIKFIKH